MAKRIGQRWSPDTDAIVSVRVRVGHVSIYANVTSFLLTGSKVAVASLPISNKLAPVYVTPVGIACPNCVTELQK